MIVRMKLVSSEVIGQHDGKIISKRPEKNAIRSAFAGKISVPDDVGGSNEWMIHVLFDENIEDVDFTVLHAGIVRQTGRKGRQYIELLKCYVNLLILFISYES